VNSIRRLVACPALASVLSETLGLWSVRELGRRQDLRKLVGHFSKSASVISASGVNTAPRAAVTMASTPPILARAVSTDVIGATGTIGSAVVKLRAAKQ
jgi:hypothetical protein